MCSWATAPKEKRNNNLTSTKGLDTHPENLKCQLNAFHSNALQCKLRYKLVHAYTVSS